MQVFGVVGCAELLGKGGHLWDSLGQRGFIEARSDDPSERGPGLCLIVVINKPRIDAILHILEVPLCGLDCDRCSRAPSLDDSETEGFEVGCREEQVAGRISGAQFTSVEHLPQWQYVVAAGLFAPC